MAFRAAITIRTFASRPRNAMENLKSPSLASVKNRSSLLPILRVGGVPEHFNIPFALAQERFTSKNDGHSPIDVDYQEVPGGTGAMLCALENSTLDVVIALCDATSAAIVKGVPSSSSTSTQDQLTSTSPIRIIGTYVTSPLCWAVSTSPNHKYPASTAKTISDLGRLYSPVSENNRRMGRDLRIGVSRRGSGSETMAYLLAHQEGFLDQISSDSFVVCSSFAGLRDAVHAGEVDFFLWENFTTRPWHNSKELNRVGDISTPWPSFVIATNSRAIDSGEIDPETILNGLFPVLETACENFKSHKLSSLSRVVNGYGLNSQEAEEWFNGVTYSSKMNLVSRQSLSRTIDLLKLTGCINKFVAIESLIDNRIAKIIE